MQHKGEMVEHAVRSSGYSITKLAQQLKMSRRWIYLAFQNPNLSIDYILAIGKIIHHDFYPEINELKIRRDFDDPPPRYNADEENPAYWKNKYLNLLEEHYLSLKKIEELSNLKDKK